MTQKPNFASSIHRILPMFPRGVALTEIVSTLGATGNTAERRNIALVLAKAMRAGNVRRERDGRWHWLHRTPDAEEAQGGAGAEGSGAALARLYRQDVELPDSAVGELVAPTMHQLLDYYHAALRSDVRGNAQLLPDRVGKSFHFFTGHGEWWPTGGKSGHIDVPLDSLEPEFRAALERRAGDDTIAVGWGFAKGRDTGVDVLWPTGLLAARWRREGGILQVTIDRADTVVNPAWVRAEAGALGWSATDLERRLSGASESRGGIGLELDEFANILREAAAPRVRDRMWPHTLGTGLGGEETGVWNAAALILPTEHNMSRRAVRDLARIAQWDQATIHQTALGALLAPEEATTVDDIGPVIETAPLNAEQLDATRSGLSDRLTLVTGPPGTGKSQTVAALVSSVVIAGGRVLVAARNHQALDAIEERIGGEKVVRTRDRDGEHDVSLLDAARQLAAVAGLAAQPSPDTEIGRLTELDRRRNQALNRLKERRCREFDLAEAIEEVPELPPRRHSLIGALLARLLRRRSQGRTSHNIAKLRRAARVVARAADPVALGDQIRAGGAAILAACFVARLAIGDSDRAALGKRLADLDFEGVVEPSEDVINATLSARPVWLTTTLSAPARLPLRAGLFDLVVIDEASQADIAASLPVMARGKRAVIVGDDRQLSFIPSLGRAHERNLVRAAGIGSTRGMGIFSQGTSSLFDLAKVQSAESAQGNSVMLVEQFRSAPDITEFIGEEFYDGRLRPAVDPDSLKVPKGRKPGIAWQDVRGRSEANPDGGYVNHAEVSAIAVHLKALLVDEGYDGSVGVVTPFNSQAGAIKRALCNAIPDEIRHKTMLKVATVDSFQGEERALMIFSPVAAGRDGKRAGSFLARDRRRINVAISRAQAIAHVFGDLSFARTGQVPALARLAAFATEPRRRADDDEAGSIWERRFGAAMRGRGLDPQPQYPVVGRRLDFALFKGEIKLDVEVDGRRWHLDLDGNRKADDVFRDAQLRSAGWRVVRFWVSELERDMEECLDRLEQELS